VFDPANLGNTLGGTPVKILSFFTDTPRALAVSPDRSTVYVAGFKTGNQTTALIEAMVCEGFHPDAPCINANGSVSPGGNPGPRPTSRASRAPRRADRQVQQRHRPLGGRAAPGVGSRGPVPAAR